MVPPNSDLMSVCSLAFGEAFGELSLPTDLPPSRQSLSSLHMAFHLQPPVSGIPFSSFFPWWPLGAHQGLVWLPSPPPPLLGCAPGYGPVTAVTSWWEPWLTCWSPAQIGPFQDRNVTFIPVCPVLSMASVQFSRSVLHKHLQTEQPKSYNNTASALSTKSYTF